MLKGLKILRPDGLRNSVISQIHLLAHTPEAKHKIQELIDWLHAAGNVVGKLTAGLTTPGSRMYIDPFYFRHRLTCHQRSDRFFGRVIRSPFDRM